MIHPRFQWCHQVAVTSACWPKTPAGQLTGCSNCTRLLAHEKKRYVMSPEHFRECVTVAREFVYAERKYPDHQGRINKCLGIFGGEPLMTPCFDQYVEILCELVPEPQHRGLWTSWDWENYVSPKWGPARPLVERLLGIENGKRRGFLNWNMHEESNVCEHHSTLVSVSHVFPNDPQHQWELINQCWLNRDWSACYAYDADNQPKFYFCEIAASMDRVLRLGTGLPVESGVWEHDIVLTPDAAGVLQPEGKYAEQIRSSCVRCGHPVPFSRGRRDFDFKDDISPDNLVQLQAVGSPMVARGDYVLFDDAARDQYNEHAQRQGFNAGRYIKQGRIRSSTVQKAASGPVSGRRRGVKKITKIIRKKR
jgi:hypothetical protein